MPSTSTTPTAGEQPPDSDEVKRKFRQALAHKHPHGGTDVSGTSERGKVAGTRRAKTSGARQMFRRKSG